MQFLRRIVMSYVIVGLLCFLVGYIVGAARAWASRGMP